VIAAGRLDRRIVVERNTPVQDTAGEPVASWATLATVWAQFEPLRGGERSAADQTDAELEVRFTVRRDSSWTPTPKDRVSWGGETYLVEAVIPLGRDEGYQLLCSGKVDD